MYSLKHGVFGSTIITGIHQDVKYELVLMTLDCSNNDNIMDLMGKWRKTNEAWFQIQFEISRERTRNWFRNRVIEGSTRALFLIKIDNEYIGHIGLDKFNFEKNHCDLDSILRGENKFPGIIFDAIKNMMKWVEHEFNIKEYSLTVFSHNSKAIKLYNKLGFIETRKIPLKKVNSNEGIELVEDERIAEKDADAFMSVMVKKRSKEC